MLGTKPKLLIADEPSSGLDSFQAKLVVQTLRYFMNYYYNYYYYYSYYYYYYYYHYHYCYYHLSLLTDYYFFSFSFYVLVLIALFIALLARSFSVKSNLFIYLRQIAKEKNIAVVCTIHQPMSIIWKLFDDIMVLASGNVVYHGERSGVIKYFSDIGYACPSDTNPAEYVIDLVSIDLSTNTSSNDSNQRIELLTQLWADHCLKSTHKSDILTPGQMDIE
jgi:ABC-type multidrug transport system ATPase subunit